MTVLVPVETAEIPLLFHGYMISQVLNLWSGVVTRVEMKQCKSQVNLTIYILPKVQNPKQPRAEKKEHDDYTKSVSLLLMRNMCCTALIPRKEPTYLLTYTTDGSWVTYNLL